MKLIGAVTLFVVLLVAACQTDPKEQEKQKEEAMVRQAQADQQTEQEFTKDSLAIAQTFEVKTVASQKLINISEEDDDGDTQNVPHYYLVSPDGKACQVNAKTYTTKIVGDTINCQWSTKFEE
jgi:hypothetical protein